MSSIDLSGLWGRTDDSTQARLRQARLRCHVGVSILAGLVELDVWDIVVVPGVARHKGEIVFEGCSRNDEVEGSLIDTLALVAEGFPEQGATPRHGGGERQDGDGLKQSFELGVGLRGVRASLYSLIGFHVADDADGDSLVRQLFKQLSGFWIVREMIDEPVRVKKVAHGLGRATTLCLLTLRMDVL